VAKSRFREFKDSVAWTIRILLTFGPAVVFMYYNATFYVVLAWVLLGAFLVMWPRSCRAVKGNGELCADNSHGLLGACRFRSHKWQNAWRFLPMRWRPLSARPDLRVLRAQVPLIARSKPTPTADPGLWGNPSAVMTTIGSASSALAVVVSVLAWWFPVGK
jgi:hypothetical protein